MGVLAAKRGGPVVHHLDKGVYIPAHMFRHRVGALVCRRQHNPVKALLHRHLLAYIPRNPGTLRFINGIMRKRNDFIHLAVFER